MSVHRVGVPPYRVLPCTRAWPPDMFRPVRIGLHSTAPLQHIKIYSLWSTYGGQAGGWYPFGMLSIYLVVFVSTLKVNSRFALEQFHVVRFCMLGVPPWAAADLSSMRCRNLGMEPTWDSRLPLSVRFVLHCLKNKITQDSQKKVSWNTQPNYLCYWE